jgi:CysZ protein
MLILSVVLMVPVASAFTGFFLEDVCRAVEAKHYPGLPPVPRPKFWDTVIETANFIGLLIAVNVLCIGFYVVALPLIPLIFWGANGLLLGREYFTLVASRRLGRPAAKALRQKHFWQVWMAGCLMAAPLSIPLVSLVIPVLGVATFTHLFQRLIGQAPRGLAEVPRSR